MKLLKWLRGPSSVSTGFSDYTEFTPIESARLKGHVRKVVIGGRQCVLRRTYLFPWQKEEVNPLWLMEGRGELNDGSVISVSMALPGDFERARKLTLAKLLDTAVALKLAQHYAAQRTA